MNSQEISTAIENALCELVNLNQSLADYWWSELTDSYDEPIPSQWNEDNLALIEKDVMMQMSI